MRGSGGGSLAGGLRAAAIWAEFRPPRGREPLRSGAQAQPQLESREAWPQRPAAAPQGRAGGGATPGAGLSRMVARALPPRLRERRRLRIPLGGARPPPEPRLRSPAPIGGGGSASPPPPRPRPLRRRRRFPAPPPPLREPPPSPPPLLPAGAQPAPAAPESSRSRSRCSRPRHERKRRRRGRCRRRLSSRRRRALSTSVVVSQAGPRGARAPAPPAPPTAAAPAGARRHGPPQPSGPRASPGGRPEWRRLRPSAGSRYGVPERARRGGAWVGLAGGGRRRVVQPPGPADGEERCPGQLCPAPEPLRALRLSRAERLTKRFPTRWVASSPGCAGQDLSRSLLGGGGNRGLEGEVTCPRSHSR